MTILRRVFRLMIALARELADENGYRRYLQQNGKVHTAAEWRLYSDKRNRRKFQNAKCC